MMTDAEILDVAHRMAWRYKKSSDPHHSDTYTFNATTMVDFARRVMAAAASGDEKNKKIARLREALDTIARVSNDPAIVTCAKRALMPNAELRGRPLADGPA